MKHMETTRAAKGLTLGDLERMTGIDRSALSRYETGKRSPSVERAALVARALGVSLESLLGVQEDSASAAGVQVLQAEKKSKAPLARSTATDKSARRTS